MALTLTADLTLIHDCEATALADTGSETVVLDNEIFVENLNSLATIVRNQTSYNEYTKAAGTWNMSDPDDHVYFWINTSVATFLGPKDSGTGLILQLRDGSGNYKQWNIAGNDTWDGRWRCFCQSVAEPADGSSGILDTAAISAVRVYMTNSAVTKNVANYFSDVLRFGKGLVATGATINIDDIYEENNLTANKYGIIRKEAGTYICQGRLTIGDESGTASTTFTSADEIVIFDDLNINGTYNHTTDSFYQVNFVGNSTGATDINIGTIVGAGDTAVGRNGILIQGANSDVGVSVDFSDADLDTLNCYGSTFRWVTSGINFGDTTTHEFTGNLIDQCGQVDPGRAKMRNDTFSGTVDNVSDGSALLITDNTHDVKFCTFSANTNATYDPHGIEFPNAGEYTLSGLSFIGNDYDAHFTASTGDLTLNFSNGTDLTTVENESSGSVYTNDYVDLTVNVEDQDGNDVDNAQAAIYKTSDDTQLMNEDTVSGSATTQFNYPGSAVSIYIRIRKSSVGTRYVPVSTTGTINSTGFTLTAVLREDTIAS